jgi:hypothetical protein
MSMCVHLENLATGPMPEGGCIDCLAIGGRWVHLRYCVECGGVRCCDNSPNRHARRHWEETGHPVIRSREPGEHWAWCYEHETGIHTPEP